MSIKYSDLLVVALDGAKIVDGTKEEVISEVKFLYTVAGMLILGSGEEELMKTNALFEKNGISIDVLVKATKPLVDNEKNHITFIDGIYMDKMLFGAKNILEIKNETTLTLDGLIEYMFDYSREINRIVNPYVDVGIKEKLKIEKEGPIFPFGNGKKETKDEKCESISSNGNPKEKMSQIIDDIKNMRVALKKSVYGQDNAINTFASAYFSAAMRDLVEENRRGPKATFLFAGAPGVGKTLLAENIAELLDLPYRRFDMSEYVDKEANLEFAGSDKVYKNGKVGNVTGFVAENPECVLIFDEVEKAHVNIIHLFLQILDIGRLRDNYDDKEVSFKDAIIIFTTNAGRQLYESEEYGELSALPQKVIMNALKNDVNASTGVPFFPPAICSRFATGNVVMFNNIKAHNLIEIARIAINSQAEKLQEKTSVSTEIDSNVCTALMLSEGGNADARTVSGRAKAFFNNELYELFRFVSSEKAGASLKDIKTVKFTLDLKQDEEIQSLFKVENNACILMFADEKLVNNCKKKFPDFNIIGVQKCETAVEELKSKNIDFIVIDINCGSAENSQKALNVYDIDSEARNFFIVTREERNSVPVYMLETKAEGFVDEEKVSFVEEGVRDFLPLYDKRAFCEKIKNVVIELHQQKNIINLSRKNKLVTFETAQSISADGTISEIKLFDFKLVTAVDADDSNNILSSIKRPNVKFEQVIGAVNAKKELEYFVNYLRNPKKYMGTGVKAPKGVLLYGPPGTGKTMLAKAMAAEANVTFISAEGNEFLKKYVGEGSAKVHEYFRLARKYAPSILFIDEIDAIAMARGSSVASSTGSDSVLTAFLTEMDGFTSDASRPVFVLAATNYNVDTDSTQQLDPALLRRFDRRIYVDLPNKDDRTKYIILKTEANKTFNVSAEKIENIAIRSTGMSLAQLDSAMEYALRSAIRQNSTVVNDDIFDEAFETFNNGEEVLWDVSQLERVARHEAGHAFVCAESGEVPSYLTVVPRGNHGGYMMHNENEGKKIFTREELLTKIRIALAGRAAELVYYGEESGISTGASGDLFKATQIAENLLCTYGMYADFGMATIKDTDSAEVRLCLSSKNVSKRAPKMLAPSAQLNFLV